MRVLGVYVKTNDVLQNQIAERDKLETFNIFDAVMYGMQLSVKQHKQIETGNKNDRYSQSTK